MSLKKTRIKGNLSVSGIQSIRKQLSDYKQKLELNTILFADRLADYGIIEAQISSLGDSHHFDDMVAYTKKWNGKRLFLIGSNADISGLHTEWYDGQGNHHTETISPILALEFGTAGLAIKWHRGEAAVTGNHVDDFTWYYFEDENLTIRHLATAEEAHEPMYNALLEMQRQITKVAREVFK